MNISTHFCTTVLCLPSIFNIIVLFSPYVRCVCAVLFYEHIHASTQLFVVQVCVVRSILFLVAAFLYSHNYNYKYQTLRACEAA